MADIEERIWTAAEAGADVAKRCIEKLQKADIFPDDKQMMERLAFIMSRNGEGTFHNDGGIWQVSTFAFEDTQNDEAHSRLARKYKGLEQAFGIKNWKDLKRRDLEVPMYSAIAARLYLSNFPEPIPPAHHIDKQQNYWWRFYMQNHESKRFMKEEDFKLSLEKDIDERIWTAAEGGADVVKRCIEKLQRADIFPDDKQMMERLAFIMSRNGEGTFHNDGGIWQVSTFAFEDTQNDEAHSRLARKYKDLEQAFRIKNWKDLKRCDLEVPMYSAIAARLYLSNFPEPIPPARHIDKQQNYWWRFYMQNHESKQFMKEEDFKLSLEKASTVVVPQASQGLPPKGSEPPATSSPKHISSSQQQSSDPGVVSEVEHSEPPSQKRKSDDADSPAANTKSLLLKTPRLSDIHRLTQPVSSSWNLIGRELAVSLNFRQELGSNSGTNEDRLELVLNQWLQSSIDPPTWSSFLNALENAKLNETCRCIKGYLETPEAKRSYTVDYHKVDVL